MDCYMYDEEDGEDDDVITLYCYPTLCTHHSRRTLAIPTASPLPLTEPGVGSKVVKPYHAYSSLGSSYDKVVYVSYDKDDEYRALVSVGVEVKGCIAVVKRGGGMSTNAVVAKKGFRD
ncbi:hypothetical protein L1987_54813 [Smallanthus sonchifolius]|uniref:Uncharacterized protein n=1 Tax=Smallanthus sonchifolius TaxID=185202 RepID=A0ACB9E8L0_9ASTR|nr:hypothetical protein L1987_54813 [Smallanthus sonchifolius]